MKAVVMAGGEGSRLRPLTSRRPKPLVPVAGRPIMEHILLLLREHGITEVVVTLQYLAAEIRNHFGDGADLGMEIDYVVEDRPLGTAGSVRNAAEHLDDTFLVISGDALTDIDLSWVVGRHRELGSLATLVLYSVPNPLEYGVVITEPNGAVRRFLEKPSWGEVFSDQANTGIYVVEPTVLDLVQPGMSYDWSQDVFPAMLRRHDPLYGVVAEGYWCDVGTIPSYLQANWDALSGRVRCSIPGRRSGEAWIGDDVEFGLDVRIEGPALIGDGAKIKAGAFLNGPVVVDKYTTIDDNAKVSNSVIWQHSYVGESTRLRQSIVCRNVTVKNNCVLDDDTVIGDDCVIGPGTHIHDQVKIWPGKEVQAGSSVNESIIWAGEWRRGLFGTNGLQGLVNVELTPEWCSRLGAAFAATLPRGATVAVTRDVVRSSRMIKRALIAGIMSAGGNVLDLSELAVPVTQHATREGCAAGIHVLASPLDARSADVRFFDGEGLPIDRRLERKVENLFFREDIRRAAFYEMGDIEYHDAIPAYREALLRGVDADAVRAAGLRLVVDYDYSSTSAVLPEVLDHLGVSVVPLHAGFSEGHRPRPPEQFRPMLEEAALITRTLHADLGCVTSFSGERLVVIDDAGTIVDDRSLVAVLAALVLGVEGAGRIVVPASAPHTLGLVAAEHGGSVVATKSDPTSLLRDGLSPGTLFAADAVGGVMWPDHLGAFDAMRTLVRLLELRARTAQPLSRTVAALPAGVHIERLEFCPWEAKGRVMRLLLERHRDERLDLADGIKLLLDDGYVLVLPDVEAPFYHVVVSLAGTESRRARSLLDVHTMEVREAQVAEGAMRAPASILEKS